MNGNYFATPLPIARGVAARGSCVRFPCQEVPLPPSSFLKDRALSTRRCRRGACCRTCRRTGQRRSEGYHGSGTAFGIPQVKQPSRTVELGKNLADVATTVGVEGVDALHLVCIITGALDCHPSPCNFPTAVENIISLQSKRRLAATASNEGGLCNPQ